MDDNTHNKDRCATQISINRKYGNAEGYDGNAGDNNLENIEKTQNTFFLITVKLMKLT